MLGGGGVGVGPFLDPGRRDWIWGRVCPPSGEFVARALDEKCGVLSIFRHCWAVGREEREGG